MYGDADEFHRFRRAFGATVFTTGCEVLGVRALEALVTYFRAALVPSAGAGTSAGAGAAGGGGSPASSPSWQQGGDQQQQQQHHPQPPPWHKAEAALFALGAMAPAVAAKMGRGSADQQQQQQQQQQPRGVDMRSGAGGGGAAPGGGGSSSSHAVGASGIGRGRGRGVALGGGASSPVGGSGSRGGGDDDHSRAWTDAQVHTASRGLEYVFAAIFRADGGGGGGGGAGGGGLLLPPLALASRSAAARLLHVSAASCAGDFARWMQRHSHPATVTHAARYLATCLRTADVASGSGGGGGGGGVGRGGGGESALLCEVGDAAAVALAKVTFVCCNNVNSAGAAGAQLCSLANVRGLILQVCVYVSVCVWYGQQHAQTDGRTDGQTDRRAGQAAVCLSICLCVVLVLVWSVFRWQDASDAARFWRVALCEGGRTTWH